MFVLLSVSTKAEKAFGFHVNQVYITKVRGSYEKNKEEQSNF